MFNAGEQSRLRTIACDFNRTRYVWVSHSISKSILFMFVNDFA